MSSAQLARDKRDSVYQSGIGMDGGYTTEDLDGDRKKARPRKKRSSKKKTANADKVCPHCGKVGHVRKTSKQCDYHSRKRAAIPANNASDTRGEPVQTAVYHTRYQFLSVNFDAKKALEWSLGSTVTPPLLWG